MLRHVTVIGNDGITLYHRSFVQDNLDDVLFSALSGAIIAFSKELGDELQSIIMKKQMIYFKSLINNIVIFSFVTDIGITQKNLEEKLNLAIKSKSIQEVCNMGISQKVNLKLEHELVNIFNLDNSVVGEIDEDVLTIEELTGDAFLDALSKLDNI